MFLFIFSQKCRITVRKAEPKMLMCRLVQYSLNHRITLVTVSNPQEEECVCIYMYIYAK